jgi:hypothetical protein
MLNEIRAPLPRQIGRSAAVGIEHHCRDALSEQRLRRRDFRIGEPCRRMAVAVDEARGNIETVGVDLARGLALCDLPNKRDSLPVDAAGASCDYWSIDRSSAGLPRPDGGYRLGVAGASNGWRSDLSSRRT